MKSVVSKPNKISLLLFVKSKGFNFTIHNSKVAISKKALMEAIEFVTNYTSYIETIKKVTKDEYLPLLEEMGKWDPHDLVKPDTWFPDENAAFGYVYRLFLKEVRKSTKNPEIILGLQ